MVETEALLFYSFAGMAMTGAIGVLISRNIVRTAIWLLATLASAAGLYFLLGASFVGAVQLIVYAGGTLVLIVFGVMLTAKDPRISFEPRAVEVVAGAAVCALVAGAMIWTLAGTSWHQGLPAQRHAQQVAQPDAGASESFPPEVRDRLTDLDADGTANLGQQLLSTYLAPFEIVSLLLLAVLIGAAYLARPRVPTAFRPGGGAPSGGQGGGA